MKRQPSSGCRYVPKGRLLEAEVWSERDSQVVLRTAREINFITNLSAHTDGPPKGLDADSGINREARGAGIHVSERLGQALITRGEIHETYFASGKQVGFSGTEVELRSEKPV